jgi:dolichol kinase
MRHRTAEGTAAVFLAVVASVVVLSWFYCDLVMAADASPPDHLFLFAASVGAFVSCLEAVTPGKVDNLVVPLVTGGYLCLLGV